jgi:hypothetical protein
LRKGKRKRKKKTKRKIRWRLRCRRRQQHLDGGAEDRTKGGDGNRWCLRPEARSSYSSKYKTSPNRALYSDSDVEYVKMVHVYLRPSFVWESHTNGGKQSINVMSVPAISPPKSLAGVSLRNKYKFSTAHHSFRT